MLDSAEALMRERGLAATGIKEIAARGKAPIGSVYHHFPGGKKELGSLALERHGAKAGRLIDAAFSGEGPVADRVRTLFRTAARGFEQSGARRSCAIGNVTLGLGATEEELRALCSGAFESWVRLIERRLPWRRVAARRSFAEMVVVALEGAFVIGRARRSGKPFLTAGEWLAATARALDGEAR